MGFSDGKFVCDQCGSAITRVTDAADGYPKLHILCSTCWAAALQKA